MGKIWLRRKAEIQGVRHRIFGGMPEKRGTYNSVQLTQKLERERKNGESLVLNTPLPGNNH